MISPNFNMESFSSVTILKYSQDDMGRKYNLQRVVNELFVNSYYGMVLQQILFPEMQVEEIEQGTLLKEDTLFTKLKRLYF